MKVEVGWDTKPYNEKNPYGKGAVAIQGDNIDFSHSRVEAIRAVKAHRATPEQYALVRELDEIARQALEDRPE